LAVIGARDVRGEGREGLEERGVMEVRGEGFAAGEAGVVRGEDREARLRGEGRDAMDVSEMSWEAALDWAAATAVEGRAARFGVILSGLLFGS